MKEKFRIFLLHTFANSRTVFALILSFFMMLTWSPFSRVPSPTDSLIERLISSESKPFFKTNLSTKKRKKIVLNPKRMKKIMFPVDRVTRHFDQKDMVQIMPTNLNSSAAPESVISVIADRSVNYWLNSPEMRNTPLVKSTKEIQEKLKTDVVLKGSRKNEIDHKFTMRYEAFQSLAKIEYQGWFRATVDYKPLDAQTQVSIQEKILGDKDLVFNQSFQRNESSSTVGMGWRW